MQEKVFHQKVGFSFLRACFLALSLIILNSFRAQAETNPPPSDVIISVEATRAETWEPYPDSLPGRFTVRRTGPLDSELLVYMFLGGTATRGADYSADTNSIVFIPGQSEVTRDITPLPDDLVETNETVFMQLVGRGQFYTLNQESQRATVTIHDRDSMPVISVEATIPDAAEPNQAGQFTVRRTGPTNSTLTVYMLLGGTATRNADYTANTNSIEFLPGQSAANRLISPLADNLIEGDETVIMQLIGRGQVYNIDEDNQRATVTIHDQTPPQETNVVVSIRRTTEAVDEPATNNFNVYVYEVSRTGPTNTTLAVSLNYTGTATLGVDYGATNTLLLPPGARARAFPITVFPDNLYEGNESVIAEVIPSSSTNPPPYAIDPQINRATVIIRDQDPAPPVVSIVATTPFVDELDTNYYSVHVFSVRRAGPTNTALSVSLSYSGAATFGADYGATNTLLLPPGARERTFAINIAPDNLVESDETVIAHIVPSSMTNPPPYAIDPQRNSATVTIRDHDGPSDTNVVVSIRATTEAVNEPADYNVMIHAYEIRRVGPTNTTLAVSLGFGGTATRGADYVATNTLVLPPGARTRTFPISVAPDTLVEGNETVVVEVIPTPSYTVDPQTNRATVIIRDQDQPPTDTNVVVSIRPTNEAVNEPPNYNFTVYTYELRRTGPTNSELAVSLSYSGTAGLGVDYTATNKIILPPGARERTFPIMLFPDTLVEGNETVIAEVIPSATTNQPPYTVDPQTNRATVIIRDQDVAPPATNVVVSIRANTEAINEPATNNFNVFIYTLRRLGPTNTALPVKLAYGGTATLGADYGATNTIVLPAGARERSFGITVFPDDLVEGNETVVAEIVPSSSTDLSPYTIEPKTNRASVIIRDQDLHPPTAVLVKPANGSVFNLGDPIEIIAEASDSDGHVIQLEIYANTNQLGAITTNRLVVLWTNAPVGQHQLTARAIDNHNAAGESTNITILVRERNEAAFVFRNLPDAYTPGAPFRVQLRAEPPSTANAYAIEDRPPQGWEISDITDAGIFDQTTGKVKFGPFTSAEPRTVTYTVHPPNSATGHREFVGDSSIDGVSYPIGGDQTIRQGSTRHPADINPADFKIVLNEVTAYAAAWKTQTNRAIPLSYMTRAGYLWKHGETYRFDPAANPPFCWVPGNTSTGQLAAASTTVGSYIRVASGLIQPGLAAEIQITITPPSGTSTYGVEEQIPRGWTVAKINQNGLFDPATSTIRWGAFYDNAERELTYTVTPPAHIAEIGRLRGIVSFDGADREILGRERVISMEDSTRPRLVGFQRDQTGLRITLQGEAGQVGILQRSADLQNWEDLTTLFLPDGRLDYLDESQDGQTQLYYRLQVR